MAIIFKRKDEINRYCCRSILVVGISSNLVRNFSLTGPVLFFVSYNKQVPSCLHGSRDEIQPYTKTSNFSVHDVVVGSDK